MPRHSTEFVQRVLSLLEAGYPARVVASQNNMTRKAVLALAHYERNRGEPGAVGRRSGRQLSLTVCLDDEMFAELKRRSLSENTSMSEQVRTLVQWGLDSEAAYHD